MTADIETESCCFCLTRISVGKTDETSYVWSIRWQNVGIFGKKQDQLLGWPHLFDSKFMFTGIKRISILFCQTNSSTTGVELLRDAVPKETSVKDMKMHSIDKRA